LKKEKIMSNKDDEPLFQGMDELERTYAPEELPEGDPERKRVRADEEDDAGRGYNLDDPTVPRPIVSVAPGSSATVPSGTVAPPNMGVERVDEDDVAGNDDSDEDEMPNG
jgi:hypothetical protein